LTENYSNEKIINNKETINNIEIKVYNLDNKVDPKKFNLKYI
jgi:hypothetical protein